MSTDKWLLTKEVRKLASASFSKTFLVIVERPRVRRLGSGAETPSSLHHLSHLGQLRSDFTAFCAVVSASGC